MARQEVTPLDPNSPWGRRLADELSEVFAEVWLNILRRRAEAEIAAETSDAA